MKNEITDIGREINEMQQTAGLSDTQLAGALDISYQTLWRWKHGKVDKIKSVYLEKIREICTIDAD